MIINKIIFRNKEAVLNIVDKDKNLLGMFFVTDKELIRSLKLWNIDNVELLLRIKNKRGKSKCKM